MRFWFVSFFCFLGFWFYWLFVFKIFRFRIIEIIKKTSMRVEETPFGIFHFCVTAIKLIIIKLNLLK